jgi:hypothetical protein
MVKENNEYDGSTPLQSFMQEAFISNLTLGMTKCDAFRQAGYKAKNASSGAIQLLRNTKVQERLAFKRGELAQKTQITLEGQIDRMRQLSQKAVVCEQMSAAISAEKEINTMCGLYQKDYEQKQQKLLVAPIIQLYGNGD